MTKKINISRFTLSAPVPQEVTFAVLADVHDRDVREIIDLTLSLSPDAVLIPGDLYEAPPRRSYYAYDNALTLLTSLAPHLPVFYTPGNHDYTYPDGLAAQMDTLGVTRLENSDCLFRGIRIGGVVSRQYDGKIPDPAFLSAFSEEEGYKILLCHHPEYFRYIRPLPIPLTIAGHAHGGQWRIFGRGIFSPGQGIFPRYTSGLYEERLLVSRGLKPSGIIPRIFNPREIVLLTLTPTC